MPARTILCIVHGPNARSALQVVEHLQKKEDIISSYPYSPQMHVTASSSHKGIPLAPCVSEREASPCAYWY